MLSMRRHVLIFACVFGAMLAITIGGNILATAGVIHDLGAFKIPMLILIFALFLTSGFAFIPIMVKLVLGAQKKIGNENVPAVAAALRNERNIVFVLWGLMALGCIIGIPAAIRGGLFNPPPVSSQSQ
jgi:hypothetical protein